MTTIATLANLKGPQGIQGLQGIPGTGSATTDVATTALINTPASAVRGALGGLYAPVAEPVAVALAAVTPTIEELIVTATPRDLTTTGSSPILVAPFPLQVISASLLVWLTPVPPSNDTNWWEFRLNKITVAGVTTQIATKNNKITGGTAIAVRVAWDFDAVAWDTTAATLAKGDILGFAGYMTGVATSIQQPMVTVRYRPL